MTETVRWPGDGVDLAGNDISGPTTKLLIDLSVLEKPSEMTAQAQATLKWETFPSLQVITAGATSLSKWVTTGVAAVGGGSAILAWLGGFWQTSDVPLKIAYVGFIGVLMSVCLISIAIVVHSDVGARAAASAAQYQARAAIAVAFLGATPVISDTARYWVRRKGADADAIPVEAFEVVEGKLVVITKTDRLSADELAMLWSTGPRNRGVSRSG